MQLEHDIRGDKAAISKRNSLAYRLRDFVSTYWDWVTVFVLAVLLWLPRLSGPIDLRWDGGVYYLLGTSLATGHGYRILSEPGAPEAIQYPPLLAAVVALHERVLGTTDPSIVALWLRRSYAAMFILFGVSLLALARRVLPKGLALIAVALCLCQIMTVFMSDLLFAELPFALLSVLFVLVATRNSPRFDPWLRESLMFLLAAAGFLLRTAGLALLGAWVLDALIRRRWRLLFLRIPLSLLPVLAWQAHVAKVRSSGEYARPAYEYQRAPYQYYNVSYAENMTLVDPFRPELGRVHPGTIVGRLAGNVFPMLKAVGETVSTKEDFWLQISNRSLRRLLPRGFHLAKVALLPMLAISAITILGLAMLVRRQSSLVVWIVLLSITLAATTPWPAQFSRYLMPIAPFLAICAMAGWGQINLLSRGKGRFFELGRFALVGGLVLVFMLQSYALIKAFRLRHGPPPSFASGAPINAGARLFYHDDTWFRWEKAVAWIQSNASPNAIVATSAPHFLYLLTGNRAVLPPMESDARRAESLLAAVPVSYVIVDELEFVDVTRRYARPAVESNPGKWRLVHSVKGTRIYERTSAVD